MHLFINLSFLIFNQFALLRSDGIQCVDHSNNPVDWFYLYKIPHMKKNKENKLIKSGVAYLYMTSDSRDSWKLSDVPITSESSILGLTLKPLYSEKANGSLLILYNDQPPESNPNSNRGHTKGVVIGGRTGGLWLIHSVPRFPPSDIKYSYPQTGTIYGQSFLCISLNSETLNALGSILLYNEPHLYARNMPSDLLIFYPDLYDVMNNVPILNPPYYNQKDITSTNGTTFSVFAKTRKFGKELYSDWVAPSLSTDLWVESWLLGPGRLNSSCVRPFRVLNIQSLNVTVANVVFESASDHSKWTVSSDKSNWICVGDINREVSQSKRGGGTVCLSNKLISESFRTIVNSTESCV